ncbi:ADP-ribosylation factor-like [Phyllobates terribilis]|uniref:ADP-ribosylation factor-like n=1 Tax=Phyllobates terribilis TaxID=111132 RepID=UPI003CCAC3B9
MGNLLNRITICLSGFYLVKARVLLLGPADSGKTTVLYRLKLHEKVTPIPTVGFNVETLEPMDDVLYTLWDITMNPNTWPFYKHYFANTQGILFVVDGKDTESHADAKQLLYMVFGEVDLEGVPFVVLVNKQDLEDVKNPSDLALDLQLDQWEGGSWRIFGCCATSGDGLHEAMSSLSVMIKDRARTIA